MLEIVRGDITQLHVDAIVNAANSALAGGGGVDGAIHRAAGPELVRASRALAPCPPGEARVTPGFALPARWVIHAVGPIWRGDGTEDAVLARTYKNALAAAGDVGASSVAFPCISTGIYGFPKEAAARIAVGVVSDGAATFAVERAIFCVFDAENEALYRSLLSGPAQ